ncbi:ogr/Delta-like zinc finger family protein [Comamonas nitrativorans]|uniref:Ogr/Delta-like zinc finger family protein n=1 Tax=Comamonas nitrativorans TaxID=108437 RepID=A0ABV9GY07_9BURK
MMQAPIVAQSAAAPTRWKGTAKEAMRLRCPHCECPCVIRSSEQMSVLTRQSVYYCVNAECGHTFVALTEIVRTLSPSATPDPSVNLPLSSHVRRDLLQVTLEHAGVAPHCTRFTKPVNGDLFATERPAD